MYIKKMSQYQFEYLSMDDLNDMVFYQIINFLNNDINNDDINSNSNTTIADPDSDYIPDSDDSANTSYTTDSDLTDSDP